MGMDGSGMPPGMGMLGSDLISILVDVAHFAQVYALLSAVRLMRSSRKLVERVMSTLLLVRPLAIRSAQAPLMYLDGPSHGLRLDSEVRGSSLYDDFS